MVSRAISANFATGLSVLYSSAHSSGVTRGKQEDYATALARDIVTDHKMCTRQNLLRARERTPQSPATVAQ